MGGTRTLPAGSEGHALLTPHPNPPPLGGRGPNNPPLKGGINLFCAAREESMPSVDSPLPFDDATTPLARLKDLVRAFSVERDWEQFHHPKDLGVALACEVGELLRSEDKEHNRQNDERLGKTDSTHHTPLLARLALTLTAGESQDVQPIPAPRHFRRQPPRISISHPRFPNLSRWHQNIVCTTSRGSSAVAADLLSL